MMLIAPNKKIIDLVYYFSKYSKVLFLQSLISRDSRESSPKVPMLLKELKMNK